MAIHLSQRAASYTVRLKMLSLDRWVTFTQFYVGEKKKCNSLGLDVDQ